MEVQYRQLFLKDLKNLKNQPIYTQIFDLAFSNLPKIETLREINNVKAMKGHANRYRIRIGDYRIGIEVKGDMIEMIRVLHRREFYRYFP